MIYLGIDPGKKGGIAWRCTISGQQGAVIMPDTPKQVYVLLSDLRTTYGTITASVEHAQPMPKQGVSSVFSYGQHFGELIGVLTALNAKICLVKPAVWKKTLGLNSDKLTSILLAERLFPDVELVPKGCRKPSDGIAEALLIMEYLTRGSN